MDISKIRIEPDRRCSAEKLEGILAELPIDIQSSGQLSARMGLGRIIYIRPVGGNINHVTMEGFDFEEQDYLFFEHGGYKFDIEYSG